MLKGYAINQKRLEYLEKAIKIIGIANRIDERQIEYTDCIAIINKLRFNEESTLFAVERDKGQASY